MLTTLTPVVERAPRGLGNLGFDVGAIVSPLIGLVTTGITLGVTARLDQLRRNAAEREARQIAQAAADARNAAAQQQAIYDAVGLQQTQDASATGSATTSYALLGGGALLVLFLALRRR